MAAEGTNSARPRRAEAQPRPEQPTPRSKEDPREAKARDRARITGATRISPE